jgi:hypothetical protein
MSRKNGYVPMEKRIADLANITDVQGNDPSTNYDPYMQGLYNGMELALAIIENRDPVFKELKKGNLIQRLIHNFRTKCFK